MIKVVVKGGYGGGVNCKKPVLLAEPDLSGFEGLTERDVKDCNKRAKKNHGDEDHHSGLVQLTIFGEALFLGIPWPGGLFHFEDNFAEILADFAHEGFAFLDVCF